MGRGRAWACESIEQGGGWGKQEHRVPLPALCLSAQFSPNSHAPSSLSLSLSLSSPAASCYAVVSPALSLSLLACILQWSFPASRRQRRQRRRRVHPGSAGTQPPLLLQGCSWSPYLELNPLTFVSSALRRKEEGTPFEAWRSSRADLIEPHPRTLGSSHRIVFLHRS